MSTLSYRKRYPSGAARATRCQHLLAVLRRAPTRRARWHRQAQRRRPWLLRPLTSGEQRLLRYQGEVNGLVGLLAPFRQTRRRGHADLYDLLCDRETRPAVLGQVLALEACVTRLTGEHSQMERQMEHWRKEWARENQRQRLTEVEKALALSNYHNGLSLLLKEARADAETIRNICPEAFAPAIMATATPPPAAPTTTTTPTPYSS